MRFGFTMMRDATARMTLLLRREPQSLRMILSLGWFEVNGLKLQATMPTALAMVAWSFSSEASKGLLTIRL